jgi:hypothetical protein
MTISNATTFIKQNIGAIGAGVGGLAVGGTLGYIAGRKSSVSKKSTRARSKRRKSRNYSSKKPKRQRRTPYTARKRKDTSHKRIRYTKKGQPYIIMASGKARFIKKKGARASHKRKGGRY